MAIIKVRLNNDARAIGKGVLHMRDILQNTSELFCHTRPD